jgi:hypothetical protein
VDETGRNSVSPSTTAMMAASMILMLYYNLPARQHKKMAICRGDRHQIFII